MAGISDITGLGSVFDFGSKVIDKIFPDKEAANAAKLRMIELQQQGEFKELDAALQIANQQMEVNKIEAASPDLFRGGLSLIHI